MKCDELLALCDKGKRRYHLIGDAAAGVVVGLDVEGRLFVTLGGEVLNRVNPEAFLETSSRERYLNPGGDGFWPAPEGTVFGYLYTTGKWRVPPGLSGARYRVTQAGPGHATVRAEVDLVNSRGLGVPLAFERRLSIATGPDGLTLSATECFEYLGDRPLPGRQCLLAPWTLAQFDCGPGCEVVFPGARKSEVWDLYDPSDNQRRRAKGFWHTRTEGNQRYQIGIGRSVDWIEFRDPRRGLTVRRTADPLPADLEHIDIGDRPPAAKPISKRVRYSVYNDANGFMEIEAAGGCPAVIAPGAVLPLTIRTTCRRA
jgi:hypothetical protein